VALRRFVDLLLIPYLPIWRTFHPLVAGSWEERGALSSANPDCVTAPRASGTRNTPPQPGRGPPRGNRA
jgi:hypothetical protein